METGGNGEQRDTAGETHVQTDHQTVAGIYGKNFSNMMSNCLVVRVVSLWFYSCKVKFFRQRLRS